MNLLFGTICVVVILVGEVAHGMSPYGQPGRGFEAAQGTVDLPDGFSHGLTSNLLNAMVPPGVKKAIASTKVMANELFAVGEEVEGKTNIVTQLTTLHQGSGKGNSDKNGKQMYYGFRDRDGPSVGEFNKTMLEEAIQHVYDTGSNPQQNGTPEYSTKMLYRNRVHNNYGQQGNGKSNAPTFMREDMDLEKVLAVSEFGDIEAAMLVIGQLYAQRSNIEKGVSLPPLPIDEDPKMVKMKHDLYNSLRSGAECVALTEEQEKVIRAIPEVNKVVDILDSKVTSTTKRAVHEMTHGEVLGEELAAWIKPELDLQTYFKDRYNANRAFSELYTSLKESGGHYIGPKADGALNENSNGRSAQAVRKLAEGLSLYNILPLPTDIAGTVDGLLDNSASRNGLSNTSQLNVLLPEIPTLQQTIRDIEQKSEGASTLASAVDPKYVSDSINHASSYLMGDLANLAKTPTNNEASSSAIGASTADPCFILNLLRLVDEEMNVKSPTNANIQQEESSPEQPFVPPTLSQNVTLAHGDLFTSDLDAYKKLLDKHGLLDQKDPNLLPNQNVQPNQNLSPNQALPQTQNPNEIPIFFPSTPEGAQRPSSSQPHPELQEVPQVPLPATDDLQSIVQPPSLPNSETPAPEVVVPEVGPPPQTEVVIPGIETVIPESEVVTPETEVPEIEPIKPETEPLVPETEPLFPETESIVPDTKPMVPETGPIVPDTEAIAPEFAVTGSETEEIAPEFEGTTPETEGIAPDIEITAPETGVIPQKPETIAPKTEAKTDSGLPTPETEIPTPETEIPTPESLNPTPEIDIPTPQTENPIPEIEVMSPEMSEVVNPPSDGAAEEGEGVEDEEGDGIAQEQSSSEDGEQNLEFPLGRGAFVAEEVGETVPNNAEAKGLPDSAIVVEEQIDNVPEEFLKYMQSAMGMHVPQIEEYPPHIQEQRNAALRPLFYEQPIPPSNFIRSETRKPSKKEAAKAVDPARQLDLEEGKQQVSTKSGNSTNLDPEGFFEDTLTDNTNSGAEKQHSTPTPEKEISSQEEKPEEELTPSTPFGPRDVHKELEEKLENQKNREIYENINKNIYQQINKQILEEMNKQILQEKQREPQNKFKPIDHETIRKNSTPEEIAFMKVLLDVNFRNSLDNKVNHFLKPQKNTPQSTSYLTSSDIYM